MEFPEPMCPGVFPAIDLRGGRCVRLVKGARDAELQYDDDPVRVARRWESEGARCLHVIDLGAAFGEPDSLASILSIVGAVRVPVQVGGGIRDEGRLQRLLGGGVARVILGTKAFQDASFLASAVERYSPRRVMVAMDFRDEHLRIGGWEEESRLGVADAIRWVERAGVNRMLVTATDRDGTLSGPRIDLILRMLEESSAWIVAAGGIGSLAHVREVLSIQHPRLEGVVVGRALYEGTVHLSEALACADDCAKDRANDAPSVRADERAGARPVGGRNLTQKGVSMTASPQGGLDEILESIKYDSSGLVPAVIQDEADGQVLMVAYMNREALRRTLESGDTCFWSRSRQEYWVKGATSGNTQRVVRVAVDCDKDCLVVVVRQKGVACHTGKRSCFYREIAAKEGALKEIDTSAPIYR